MDIVHLLVNCILFSYCHIFVLSYTSDNNSEGYLTSLAEYTLAEDGKLNFTELAAKYGYKAEVLEVTTDDGYILEVFFINGTKPSVLLFHGVAESGDAFIVRGNTSLVTALVNKGYSVWVGNSRGTKYSRRHVDLDPDTNRSFWNYSFNEIGYYDLAATIDFIREETGEDRITTISISQGATCHYALTTLRPEYNDRIKISIQLAPIVYLNHLIPPLSLVLMALPALGVALEALGVEELFKDQGATSDIIKFICTKGLVSYAVCAGVGIFSLYGFDPVSITPDFLKVALGHFPAGTSRKSLLHFDQIFLRKKFSQYDYGVVENLIEYGSATPPDYDLSLTTMKIAILYGLNDNLARPKDVEDLKNILSNVVHYEAMEPKLWNHIDFVWGANMTQYLFPSIFKLLEEYI